MTGVEIASTVSHTNCQKEDVSFEVGRVSESFINCPCRSVDYTFCPLLGFGADRNTVVAATNVSVHSVDLYTNERSQLLC